MKTLLLALLVTAAIQSSFSQNQYFTNAPVWQFTSACQAGFPCIENRNYIYYVNGDTLINNLTYIKLFTRGSGFYSWSGPPPTNCSGYFSFNDTINPAALLRDSLQKIFIYTQNGEELLYDFSLNPGDSIPGTSVTYEAVVTSVDSILVASSYRKRIHFNDQSGVSHFLIEGIGHPNGFLEPVYPILECGRDLVCFGYSDSSYYPFTGSDCNYIAATTENVKSTFELFPNPATEKLYIKNTGTLQDFRIMDLAGKEQNLNAKMTDGLIQLETGSLKPGTYFVFLRDKTGNRTLKFLKE
jgi:hypothetical protein